MQLKHLKNLLQHQDGAAKIASVCWAPNNGKLAVCTADRVVLLFDENGEKRDKFSTKPADPKYGKKSYVVTGMAFSPDSTKIAVAQSDNIIYVYRIGEDWRDKKVICNKFVLQSAVTCLVWPTDGSIIFGLADGKVRIASLKTNKSSTVYATESYVVSLATNISGKGFISGHANGAVVRYFFDGDTSGEAQGKLLNHSCPPYAMAWAANGILIGGCDKRIIAYNKDGRNVQQFDYSRDETERDFASAACSPSGQSVVFGSYDRLRVFNWSNRKGGWEEDRPKEVSNLYTIACLAWKRDGSKVAAGTLCGGVELFDCCLKKTIYKNKFEITYVGLSQVIVKNLSSQAKVTLKSNHGYEIDDVRVLGGERYLVARTPETLLLADLQTNRLSEVPWHGTGGNERFYFDNESVCMIFNAGELTLVEYGSDFVLGSVRTEFMNPHLISVRVNERNYKLAEVIKKMSYLVDLKTIAVFDLVSKITLAQIFHDSKIDWLELNETGRKLLFRDKRLRLSLVDCEQQTKMTILNYCTFVQWVPDSDVVVAQNRGNLCVWYNIDVPEKVTMIPIKGEVLELIRSDGKTEVLVKDGVTTLSYTLDESLIEFTTAVEDGNYARAVSFLETLEMVPETEAMWNTLSKLALKGRQFQVAQRCFSALGDVAKARYLQSVIDSSKEINTNTGIDGIDHYLVRARLEVLDKRFKVAEAIYLEHDDLEGAMTMYQRLHKWEDAIHLAEFKGHPDLDALKARYLKWLLDTRQEEKAGELKEREGDHEAAVNFYMKAGAPARAAVLVSTIPNLSSDSNLTASIATALINADLHEKAGELYHKSGNNSKALECYRKGKAFQRAVELARISFPREVVPLEEEWGDHLASQKQLDAAINHYIEAGSTVKALDAAVHSHQWKKAVQIVKVIDDPSVVTKYYHLLGQHFCSVHDYEMAEHFYTVGGLHKEAINMFNGAKLWDKAYSLATSSMKPDEISMMYSNLAQQLEQHNQLNDVEKIYLLMGDSDSAITMYKKHQQYERMLKLVKSNHPDLLPETHFHLAKELESSGNFREAEKYYLELKDWKTAVNMYCNANMWPEAHRVAKSHGGQTAAKQAAFMWAQSLGGEPAVRLLNKFGLLEFAVDYAMKTMSFDFAFNLARLALKEKVPEIHLKHAMYLEDVGRFNEAEIEFIKAGKPKEAILMYVHNEDWEDACRIAEAHDPESMADILVGQAKAAFTKKDFTNAESLLLRAQRPELAVKHYKDNGMWLEALRVCREYLPHKLQLLQEEYERESGAAHGPNGSSAESLLSQARQCEESGDFARAVDAYLRITVDHCNDATLLEKSMTKGVELAGKFLGNVRAIDAARSAGPQLIKIQKFNTAAQLYMRVGLNKEAVDSLLAGGEFTKARKVAKELDPRLELYVEEKYKESLKRDGNVGELASVDVLAALNIYAQKGQWQKCIEMAEQQTTNVLHKYLALFAAELIGNNKPLDALKLYSKHGAPAFPRNFNIYIRITLDILNLPNLNNSAAYKTWARLRDVLFDLTTNLEKSTEAMSATRREEFDTLLIVTHYYATRSACLSVTGKSLDPIAAKLSVSLLRHTEVVPADKAYYEAGFAAKNLGWENMAFVLLNRYLDICEAIEDSAGSSAALDNSDFQDTDIPYEFPLPEKQHVDERQHEEIKDWVLSVSMDQRVEQVLPVDERMTYEASLLSINNGERSPPCIISGYPVFKEKIEFKKEGRVASKDNWNKFLMATKMSQSEECQDVLRFIGDWCGTPANLTYSFQ